MEIFVPERPLDKPEEDYTLEDAEAEFEENWYDYGDEVVSSLSADALIGFIKSIWDELGEIDGCIVIDDDNNDVDTDAYTWLAYGAGIDELTLDTLHTLPKEKIDEIVKDILSEFGYEPKYGYDINDDKFNPRKEFRDLFKDEIIEEIFEEHT